ncbi:hypothetical protein LNP00_00960 [Fructobacillus sp. M158]|uniref:pectate lyase-like adhesive domain-containing protein n=1 Tax=Fructobacillus parabroussonetiae TaxID=2713174 RepID=UPI00200AC22C|nr:pectate lyase-like adhesive domain-containing protein [Fructobacillus parabroussonetiae]MCK8616940.1 hypothetical protein [Fructobacillus parabroussonetiae]
MTKIFEGYSETYLQGYNSVVDSFNSGSVYVSDGQQFATSLLGNNHNIVNDGVVPNTVKVINLVDDVDFTNVAYSQFILVVNNLNNLTIDGQNHLMDTHGVSYRFVPTSSQSVLNIQNFQTLSTWNYFGSFQVNSTATMKFMDVNFFGPQLLSSPSTNVIFEKNINAINTERYSTPFTFQQVTQSDHEENLEVSNLTLKEGANYFASTTKNGGGGTAVYMTGQLLLGKIPQ